MSHEVLSDDESDHENGTNQAHEVFSSEMSVLRPVIIQRNVLGLWVKLLVIHRLGP